jgi:hypothetical protein
MMVFSHTSQSLSADGAGGIICEFKSQLCPNCFRLWATRQLLQSPRAPPPPRMRQSGKWLGLGRKWCVCVPVVSNAQNRTWDVFDRVGCMCIMNMAGERSNRQAAAELGVVVVCHCQRGGGKCVASSYFPPVKSDVIVRYIC